MSFAENREQYLTLMRSFVAREISGVEFERRFATLWRKDRDDQYAQMDRSGSSLTSVVRQQPKPLDQMLGSVFTACDVFDPNETTRDAYEYSEDQLRDFVAEALSRFAQDAQRMED